MIVAIAISNGQVENMTRSTSSKVDPGMVHDQQFSVAA